MEPEKKTWNKNLEWPKEIDYLKSIANKVPELEETVKWGGIAYTYNGKNVLGIGGFKNFFTIWFFKGVFLKDEANVLVNAQEGTTKSLRQWRFTSLDEVDEKMVLKYIKEAIEVEKAGLAVKPTKKETVVPPLLQAELDNSPEMKQNFESLSPYKQREYCEYIETAKREATQQSRMEKIKPMILKGLGMNDKYR